MRGEGRENNEVHQGKFRLINREGLGWDHGWKDGWMAQLKLPDYY